MKLPFRVAALGQTPGEAIALDKAGNVYVSDPNSNRIYKYTSGGVYEGLFATTSPGGGIAGLVFDTAGNLYVSDTNHSGIETFTPSGVGSVFASTGLNEPRGMAFDTAGNLYVANFGSSTIEKFTPGGVESVFATNISLAQGIAFTSVPEPASLVLGGLALASLALFACARHRRWGHAA